MAKKVISDAILKGKIVPEVTVYSKAKYLSVIEANKAKFLSDMDTYKKDSTEWATANKNYQDSLKLYNTVLDMANNEVNTYLKSRAKEVREDYKKVASGSSVEFWRAAKAKTKDTSDGWHDMQIAKAIKEQKYYSNPANIEKEVRKTVEHGGDSFQSDTGYQLKYGKNKFNNRYDYPEDGHFYTNMDKAKSGDPQKYKKYLDEFINYRETELADAIKNNKSSVSVSGMAVTNREGAKAEIDNAKKLRNLIDYKIKPIGYTSAVEGLQYSVYKKPTSEPVIPERPIDESSNVKYDPKYESLRMRPLWANIAKRDRRDKIGTLIGTDRMYENGFTIDEAKNMPQEIKDKYNIDFILGQIDDIAKGRIKPKSK